MSGEAKTRYGASLAGFRQQLEDSLLELGEVYPNMVVVDAETSTATNIIGFRDKFPERFVTCGIAEQAAVSFAFALSRSNIIPVVPLFSCFITRRAYDQLYLQMGYAHSNVKVIGCYSGITSPNTGATHQSIVDVACMRAIPGMTVIEAADIFEFKSAMEEIMKYKGPVFLRMVRGDIDPYDKVRCVPEGYQYQIGKSPVLREGTDISLVAGGIMVPRALEAADILAGKGISAEVVDCSSIKPIDTDTLVASAKKTGKVVCCENSNIQGNMGGAVAECLVQHCPVPMRFAGVNERYGWSGDLKELLPAYGISTENILEKAYELL